MSPNHLVACPSCKTQLRPPAGNAGRIRCPKCQTVLKLGSSQAATTPAASAPHRSTAPSATAPSSSMVIRCNGCQKKMKVPSSSAGKKVRCPSCQMVLQVPASGRASQPVAAPLPAQAPESSPFDGLPSGGFPSAPAGPAFSPAASPSPFSQPLATPTSVQNPYAATTTQPASVRTSAGTPPPAAKLWMIIGIAASASTLLPLIGMLVFPPIALVAAILGYGGGALASSVAGIWLLVLAFQEDIVQGLLCLFVPFYILYYMFKEWDRTWLPSMIYWTSAVVMIGSMMGTLLGALIVG